MQELGVHNDRQFAALRSQIPRCDCRGCGKLYPALAHLERHCQARPAGSTCRIWWDETIAPSFERRLDALQDAAWNRQCEQPEGQDPNNDQDMHAYEDDNIPPSPVRDQFSPPPHNSDPIDFGLGDSDMDNNFDDIGIRFSPPRAPSEAEQQWIDGIEAELQDNAGRDVEDPDNEGEGGGVMRPEAELAAIMEELEHFGSDSGDDDQVFEKVQKLKAKISSRVSSTQYFPQASRVFGRDQTFLDIFQSDRFSEERRQSGNVYYPFAGKMEWEFTNVLSRMSCSLAEKTELLKTSLMQTRAGLSYKDAHGARGLVDMLPEAAVWVAIDIEIDGFTTKKPLTLYTRDALKCLQRILNNPLFVDSFNPIPRMHFDSNGNRIITDAMSGNWAWNTQKKLPEGHTLIPVAIASDKAHLDHREMKAHPFTITTNAIDTDPRITHASYATLMVALIPIPKFNVSNANLHRSLYHQLFHKSVRLVTAPLRDVSHDGTLLSDPWGDLRMSHPILSNIIADLPEILMYISRTENVSPVTIAKFNQFGEAERMDTRWGSDTYNRTNELASQHNLTTHDGMQDFVDACYQENLTGVCETVFDGWAHSEPAHNICFDTLHFGLKFFYDHIFKWVKAALGDLEIDFRYSVIAKRIGWRHFDDGVSRLVKTGGVDHRLLLKWMLPVIAGGVPPKLAKLCRAYVTYTNRSRRREFGGDDLSVINANIQTLHDKKQIALDNRYRVLKKRIYLWGIPKLELQHHIVRTIQNHGDLRGVSTEQLEGLHPTIIKNPYRRTNRKAFEGQMVQNLNRMEKLHGFDLATSLLSSGAQINNAPDLRAPLPKSEWLSNLDSVRNLQHQQRSEPTDLFKYVDAFNSRIGDIPAKYINRMRTRVLSDYTAIRLNRDPNISSISIEEASDYFRLPDLKFRIAEYFYSISADGHCDETPRGAIEHLSRHHKNAIEQTMETLPFGKLKVWFSIRVQNLSVIDIGKVNPAQCLIAQPPSRAGENTPYKLGRCDTALFVNDLTEEFTGKTDLKAHTVGQLRLLFQPISDGRGSQIHPYLVYVQRFDPVNKAEHTGLQRLRRKFVGDEQRRDRYGGVVDILRIRKAIEVCPYFGEEAHGALTVENSMEISNEFTLNHSGDLEDDYIFSHLA